MDSSSDVITLWAASWSVVLTRGKRRGQRSDGTIHDPSNTPHGGLFERLQLSPLSPQHLVKVNKLSLIFSLFPTHQLLSHQRSLYSASLYTAFPEVTMWSDEYSRCFHGSELENAIVKLCKGKLWEHALVNMWSFSDGCRDGAIQLFKLRSA